MSFLVTGGLGFIGSKVVIQLLKRGIPTIVTDINIEKNKDKLLKLVTDIKAKPNLLSFEKLHITD